MKAKPVLLIEDDESLGATLTENLALDGYSVDWIRDGKSGLDAAKKGLHSLVILDLMIPQLGGLDVLKSLREVSQIPVLIISAKGTPQDRIRGLELRADDYLPKPFHLKEFTLRVQSLLRRNTANSHSVPQRVKLGPTLFDPNSFTLTKDDGTIETLTDKEAKVLSLLISRANSVVRRDEILDLVWGLNSSPTPRTIDNVIVKLRKWVERDPSNPEIIISHRGHGYLLKLSEGESK